MPVSITATVTEREPLVTFQALDALIFVSAHCRFKSGSFGVSEVLSS